MSTIGMAVVFAILLVAANAMMMNQRERTSEVAVMKTVGFSDRRRVRADHRRGRRHLAHRRGDRARRGDLLSERTGSTPADFSRASRSPGDARRRASVALLLTVASGIFPAWQAAKLPVVQALRRVNEDPAHLQHSQRHQRPVSTALTALGIGLVVAVFVAMLALANGFIAALVRTGSPENVLRAPAGADTEMSSGIPRDAISIVTGSPHIATRRGWAAAGQCRDVSGRPLPAMGGQTPWPTSSSRREDKAFEVRRNIKVDGGSPPRVGPERDLRRQRCAAVPQHESEDAALRQPRLERGLSLHRGRLGFESEIWGRTSSSSAAAAKLPVASTFRLKDPAGFEEAKRALEADQRLQMDAYRESEFYANQSELLGNILRFLGDHDHRDHGGGRGVRRGQHHVRGGRSRTPEIAVLLTLGFHPRSVLASFLAESAVIALIGGVLGACSHFRSTAW